MTPSAGRRAALAAAAALALAGVAPRAAAQDPRAGQAQEAAREWLALADRIDAAASHEAAGEKFRVALPMDRWTAALNAVREPLGAVGQRTALSTQLTRTLPGQPPGDYALVAFRTSWMRKSVGRELVSLEFENGRWRVIGYVIQ